MVVGKNSRLAAVGSATVAVLSQSSGIAAIFAMRRVTWYRSAIIAAFTYILLYNNCALYMLLYKQCRGFYRCSKRVVNARSVF